MIINENFHVRPYKPSDFNFIISTWLHQYKTSSYFAKRIKHSLFYRNHNKVIQSIFNKPQTSCLILHDASEPDVIFGFFVFERRETPVLHFMFIKEELRGQGLGTSFFKASQLPIDGAHFSHWTFPMNEIVIKCPNLIYNPYSVML